MCHSERSAPRSESKITMIASGNHTIIYYEASRRIFCVADFGNRKDPSTPLHFAQDDTCGEKCYPAKLSFSGPETFHCCVIPSQCAHWRGNPFSCGAKHRAAFGGRGCGLPHQPAGWFAMTPAGRMTTPLNYPLCSIAGDGVPIPLFIIVGL